MLKDRPEDKSLCPVWKYTCRSGTVSGRREGGGKLGEGE